MNIYVGNLPYTISEGDLEQLFGEYGSVDSVKIISDKFTGKSKGFGFVEMDDNGGEEAVENLNGHEISGRPLKVNKARPRENNFNNRDRGGRDNRWNIYVGNLPYNLSEGELENLFAEYGSVDSVKIISDKFTGKSKGFAFVEMEDAGGEEAIEGLNGTV
ncbi:UNVERIFIED_CONTAM: hypothetical protein GTU68_000175 [Idotea baltica]|nr:hypothetical protein [Idotea baltica]